MIRIISFLYPRRIRDNIAQLLMYCDVKTDVAGFITRAVIIGTIISLMVALFVRILFDFSFIITFFSTFMLTQATTYAWLVLTADARAGAVEEILPDVLQLMSSNLRAGLTVDKAFLLAARPEFGRFQNEINRVGKEIATGTELGTALSRLSSRVRSDKLRKTFQLINSAMASGGQLSDLLQQTASNLREQRLVEQRIRSSVLTYVIFIFSAIGFGSPMLFGLSSFLIEVITDIFSKIQLPPTTVTAQIPIAFSKVTISPKFVNAYTISAMMITSLLGSLILGLIAKGKEKEGLKFLPFLVILTISLFFLIKFAIGHLLSGLFEI